MHQFIIFFDNARILKAPVPHVQFSVRNSFLIIASQKCVLLSI